MTANVQITVPAHVHAVVIQFEGYTPAHGWLPANCVVVRSGDVFVGAVWDTHRISLITERTEEQMRQGDPTLSTAPERLNTINEHAHGDDHHEHHRSHSGLSNG